MNILNTPKMNGNWKVNINQWEANHISKASQSHIFFHQQIIESGFFVAVHDEFGRGLGACSSEYHHPPTPPPKLLSSKKMLHSPVPPIATPPSPFILYFLPFPSQLALIFKFLRCKLSPFNLTRLKSARFKLSHPSYPHLSRQVDSHSIRPHSCCLSLFHRSSSSKYLLTRSHRHLSPQRRCCPGAVLR